jgi:hypothetical protein
VTGGATATDGSLDGGGGGGASLVTGGGATVADGAVLGGGAADVLVGAGAGGTGWLVKLVSENATPPMATIETRAATPKNSCGKRLPPRGSSRGSILGSCSS